MSLFEDIHTLDGFSNENLLNKVSNLTIQLHKNEHDNRLKARKLKSEVANMKQFISDLLQKQAQDKAKIATLTRWKNHYKQENEALTWLYLNAEEELEGKLEEKQAITKPVTHGVFSQKENPKQLVFNFAAKKER